MSEINFSSFSIVRYNHIVHECEQELLSLPFDLQSETKIFDIDHWNEIFDSQIVTKFLGKYDNVTKLIEDLLCLCYTLSKSSNKKDVVFSCLNFMKLRCGDSSLLLKTSGYFEDIMVYITEIFSSNHPLTSNDDKLEADVLASLELQDGFLDTTRSYLSMYSNLRFGPLFKRCQKLITYLIAFSLFKPFGVDLKSVGYSRLEAEVLTKKIWSSDEAIFNILETLQFLCERGYACITTGSLDALFHSGSSYDKFYVDYQKLRKWHPMIGHQDLMDTERVTEHAFLALLDSTIERGESIAKYVKDGSVDKKIVSSTMNELYMIRCHHLTIKNALQDRKAPFPILLYGDSGIGKTTLTSLLFNHFGKRRNQPVGDEYKYVKNPVAKYWDNFRSNMWCVVLDDIAFMKPSIAQAGGDKTCMEMIQIVNNVPFVPDQASLELKGKMPLKCELVIGTTNTPHLNAYYYFACPSAVQRRFPFIIDVKIKPEYVNEQNMLDSNKVPANIDEYPDYWLWTVKRIVPQTTRVTHQSLAESEILLSDGTLKEFLIWYNKAIDAHYENQAKASNSVDNIRSVQLCTTCCLPMNLCDCKIQNDVVSSISLLFKLFALYFFFSRLWYKYSPYIMSRYYKWFTYPFYSLFYLKICFVKFVPRSVFERYDRYISYVEFEYEKYIRQNYRSYWKLLGAKIAYTVAQPVFLTNAVIVLTGILLAYKAFPKKRNNFPSDEYVENAVRKEEEEYFEQFGVRKVLQVNEGMAPTPMKEEPNNVWYNDRYELHQMDLGNLSIGWNQLSDDEALKRLSYNCVYLYTQIADNKFRRTGAVCVTGQIYLLNSHFFRDLSGDIQLKIGYQGDKQGVNANTTLMINCSNIYFKENSDVCLVEFRGLPPRLDIISLFCKESYDGKTEGYYLRRNFEGEITATKVRRIRQIKNHIDRHISCEMDVWAGLTQNGCTYGDCGSLLYTRSGYGPVLLGIHFLGNERLCDVRAVKVTQEFLYEAVNKITSLNIQGTCISVDAPSVPCKVIDLHKKSAFRYLDSGSGMVCGSLTLPRAHGKSRVENTPMNEYLTQFGYETKYTNPDLVSWRPWHLAAKEMVMPANKFKPSIMEACVAAFTKDILKNISQDLLKSTVHVYDDFTAINGAAGVTFVDKLNRNTSMGHPYNKSKRFYLRAIEARGENLDPVEFTPEIQEQIKFVEDNYILGKRYNAIFRANLKDEPVTFAKADLGKTRVFAGAPVAWSVVNRKYTLSLIRLIQSNQYTFECACGIICQSAEWDVMRDYLTSFGDNRLVAGDFEKFDKRMCAELIQWAFDILINICRESGNYSQQDLLVVRGIAIDTAFAWMNFNGDLVSFFGSNPSGHPLTVIINSLVNSLYMRYCFTEITQKSPTHFKEFVHLMTYGDDNIMNVSESIPQFNHTSIQSCLREVGVGYTMADKNAPSIPYIHIDECSFLKRTWRYDEDFGGYVAPLDHDSIEKMLMTWVRSKTISAQEQCIAVISSAVMEYAFYGKIIFEDKVSMLKQMCRKLDLDIYITESTFPTFKELTERYKNASRKPTGASACVRD